jgi:hypothetical protein
MRRANRLFFMFDVYRLKTVVFKRLARVASDRRGRFFLVINLAG